MVFDFFRLVWGFNLDVFKLNIPTGRYIDIAYLIPSFILLFKNISP